MGSAGSGNVKQDFARTIKETAERRKENPVFLPFPVYIESFKLYENFELCADFLFCQDLDAVFRDENHIFDLGGKSVVHGINGPSVVFVNKEVRRALVDHRLDREHHTRNKKHLASFRCDIADERILMKFQSDPVSADVFHDRVAVRLCVAVDRISDIA